MGRAIVGDKPVAPVGRNSPAGLTTESSAGKDEQIRCCAGLSGTVVLLCVPPEPPAPAHNSKHPVQRECPHQ